MRRREFISGLGALSALAAGAPLLLGGRAGAAGLPLRRASTGDEGHFEPVELTEGEWQDMLSEAAFRVLRKGATERAFTSPLNDEKRSGTYVCAGCFLPLFESGTKFESGTGWPSFYAPIPGHVDTKLDFKLILPRTEYHCARCGGHQGHVFDDGPEPTGKRWCNNGVALRFVPEGEPLPELRP